MNTHRLIPRLLATFALVAALGEGPARGQGTTTQTLMWQTPTNGFLSPNVPHPLRAIASSGLPVTFRVDSGPAVIANSAITVMGPGTVVVTADQTGDTTYLPSYLTRRFNENPRILLSRAGEFPTTGSAIHVRMEGNNAYLSEGLRGQVIDVSDPTNPVRLSGYDIAPSIYPLVMGNYAYWIEEGSMLTGPEMIRVYFWEMHIVDISNPESPVRRGSLTWFTKHTIMRVAGNHAYLLEENGFLKLLGKLKVIDISNPSNPQHVGEFEPFGYFTTSVLHVVGNYAYWSVHNAESGPSWEPNQEVLLVIDVNNPEKPVQVGQISTPGMTPIDMQVQGNYAYLAGTGGLQVIDLSNATEPKDLGGLALNDVADSVQVVGSYVYIAARSAGLQIIKSRLGYPQTLELQLPKETSFHDLPAASVGTASSGLPLSLSIVSGPATVVNNQLTWTGLGQVTLRAEQPGDEFFLPASAEWTVTVVPRRLGFRVTEGTVELFWTTGFPGLQLQGRESLQMERQWQNITTTPVETDAEARVPMDAASPLRYFRLLKP